MKISIAVKKKMLQCFIRFSVIKLGNFFCLKYYMTCGVIMFNDEYGTSSVKYVNFTKDVSPKMDSLPIFWHVVKNECP